MSSEAFVWTCLFIPKPEEADTASCRNNQKFLHVQMQDQRYNNTLKSEGFF